MKIYRVQGVTISKQNSECPPYFDTPWTKDRATAEAAYNNVSPNDFISQLDDKNTMKFIFGFEKRILSADVDEITFPKMQNEKNINKADSFIGFDYTEEESDVIKP
jgi:hypothetical protein